MRAQKESIPDRASVHAKKGDFGPKKPRGVTWVNFCWVCAAGISEPTPLQPILWPIPRANYGPHLCHF